MTQLEGTVPLFVQMAEGQLPAGRASTTVSPVIRALLSTCIVSLCSLFSSRCVYLFCQMAGMAFLWGLGTELRCLSPCLPSVNCGISSPSPSLSYISILASPAFEEKATLSTNKSRWKRMRASSQILPSRLPALKDST